MNTIISLLFPAAAAYFGQSIPFIFFAVMTGVQFFTVLFTYPESKGLSLEDLQRRLLKSAPVPAATAMEEQ